MNIASTVAQQVTRYVQRGRERRSARDQYFNLDRRLGHVLRSQASQVESDAGRINLLQDVIYLTEQLADAVEVFDNNRTDDHGFTPAEWTRSEARLYRLVLATEVVAAGGEWGWGSMDGPTLGLSEASGVPELMHRMAEATTVEERAGQIRDLWDLVVGEVGGQAAEALVSLSGAYYEMAGKSSREAYALAWRV